MKKLIRRIIIGLVPWQAGRRRLRQRLFQRSPDWHYQQLEETKRAMLVKINTASVLVIGSSHAKHVFDRYNGNDIICMATISQDIYYSYMFYDLVMQTKNDINTVVLFYSVFSPNYELQKAKTEKIRCAYIKLVFDIDYKYNTDCELDDIYKRLVLESLSETYDPCLKYKLEYAPENALVFERCKNHMKCNNTYKSDQMNYLNDLYNSVKANNHNLVIVLSPARRDYQEQLPAKKELFKEIFDWASSYNVKVVDLYDDVEYDYDDFGDYDHCNEKGAKKTIDKIIRAIKKL